MLFTNSKNSIAHSFYSVQHFLLEFLDLIDVLKTISKRMLRMLMLTMEGTKVSKSRIFTASDSCSKPAI